MSAFDKLLASISGQSPRPPLRVLAASGQLGYGIPEAALKAGIARKPHVIGADMGSIDPGPAYLGSGNMATSPSMTARDLRLVLTAARQLDVPLLIGSAGTAGTNSQLHAVAEILRQVAAKENLHFNLALIEADMPRDVVVEAVNGGRTQAIGAIAALDNDTVNDAANIVGQMGVEAFHRALALGADVILAGRACDTAVFSAVPILLGYPAGEATHMAKIIECSSICCIPGGRDAMLGTLDENGFVLESMNPDRRATPTSVAAHSLYEQADPYTVAEPDGVLHVDSAQYEAVDERRVRVHGARWEPSPRASVKIEGATWVGERAILMAGAADARFIENVEDIISAVKETARDIAPPDPAHPYVLYFRHYGLNGVVDWPEPPEVLPREIFLLGECIAATAEEAKAVIAVVRQHLLHHGFPGRLSTGGNLAFPLTPPEMSAGTAYRFSVYHIMSLENNADLSTLFPIRMEEL
ncbi:MAG: acyclic terpene utilization AtuA family protein [Alphaproteobacteria bacterium]|nr:acyclic terpene utilization AtuA family protein [Alphaproteobacteria bacterium]